MRLAGGKARANADISNERGVRIPSAENPRFPESGQSPQGKSGPKVKPIGVADGKQAKIPAPGIRSDARVKKDSRSW